MELRQALVHLEIELQNVCLNTVLAVFFIQLVRYLLWQLRQKAKCPYVLSNGWLWNLESSLQLIGCLVRILPKQLAQALIMKLRWATLPRPIFDIMGLAVKAREPILCCVLRNTVFTECAVEVDGRFSCFQSTFEIVEHKPPNIRYQKVHHYLTLDIPCCSFSIYNTQIHWKLHRRTFSNIPEISCEEYSWQLLKLRKLATELSIRSLIAVRI